MAKVLIVDDEIQICDLVSEILEAAGYSVVCANDGQAALDMLGKGRFDLALVDVMMPKIDGYHLATHINGLPNPPAIVFVSARDVDQDEKVVETLGAAAYLMKPFEKRELLRVVSNVLTKKPGNH